MCTSHPPCPTTLPSSFPAPSLGRSQIRTWPRNKTRASVSRCTCSSSLVRRGSLHCVTVFPTFLFRFLPLLSLGRGHGTWISCSQQKKNVMKRARASNDQTVHGCQDGEKKSGWCLAYRMALRRNVLHTRGLVFGRQGHHQPSHGARTLLILLRRRK